MEKYLISSPPQQLSQQFDNDTFQLGYDYDQAIANQSQTQQEYTRTDTDEDEDDLVVPVSNNNNNNNSSNSSNNMNDTSVQFSSFVHLDSINANLMEVGSRPGHSRNFSFDNDPENSFLEPKSFHQSTLSMVSINQDPPSMSHQNGNSISFPSIPQSTSTSTMYSMDSIPQLTSSTSNQSLAESPNSFQPNSQFQNHMHNHIHHHPHGVMATPRRAGRKKSSSISSGAPFSTPLNTSHIMQSPIVTNTTSKITKTPHFKPSHARSRSRVSVDLKNGANPFYTPSQQSFLSMAEDSGTPLLTPTASSKRSTRIRPSSSGTFFSPLSSNTSTTIQSSTLDRIEIPEDDALKQLRKARSFSSLSKRKSQQQYPQQQSQSEPQHSMIFGEDLSIRFEQDLNSSETLESTSSSTPGVFYNDMPGSGINYEASLRSLSVPSSATSSTVVSGIDLLSPQFDNSRPSPYPQVNKSFSRSLTGSNSFIKSYPASIDLATIANSHYQATNGGLLPPMATFTVQHNDEDSDEEQQLPRHSESDEDDTTVTLPIPQDLQITIPVVRNNRSEKNDKVDPKKKHKCPICESRFQRPEHVKRHMKSHSSEKPFQCEEPDCGKRFNRKDNLKAHLKKIHGKQV